LFGDCAVHCANPSHVWKLEDVLHRVKVLVTKESHSKFSIAITHSTGMAQWTLKGGPNATQIMLWLVSIGLAIHSTAYKWQSAVRTRMHDGHSVKK
jgi:hypothetical protein